MGRQFSDLHDHALLTSDHLAVRGTSAWQRKVAQQLIARHVPAPQNCSFLRGRGFGFLDIKAGSVWVLLFPVRAIWAWG